MFAVVVNDSIKTVMDMDGRTANDNSEKSYTNDNSKKSYTNISTVVVNDSMKMVVKLGG